MLRALDWEYLTRKEPPFLHFTSCTEAAADSYAYGLANARTSEQVGVMSRIIRGEECATLERLMQECAAALQFPCYFGRRGWDAFAECIRDLHEWIANDKYALFVTRVDRILRNDDEQFVAFVEILQMAAEYWMFERGEEVGRDCEPRPFHVVLHCEPEAAEHGLKRIRQTGVPFNEIVLWHGK